MKLWQAKAHAAKLWPAMPLRFCREGNACVMRRDEEEFGRGGSWLEAMRDAALRWTKCSDVDALRQKAKAEERAGATHAAGRGGSNDRNAVHSDAAAPSPNVDAHCPEHGDCDCDPGDESCPRSGYYDGEADCRCQVALP